MALDTFSPEIKVSMEHLHNPKKLIVTLKEVHSSWHQTSPASNKSNLYASRKIKGEAPPKIIIPWLIFECLFSYSPLLKKFVRLLSLNLAIILLKLIIKGLQDLIKSPLRIMIIDGETMLTR